ncbi:LOW QUALITY PROTEIN: hypothetical protein U9M48_041551, partial [Paspalum notatum var. saurae]
MSAFIWTSRAPPCVQFFGWLASKDRVQCRCNLVKKGIVPTDTSEVCAQDAEDTTHILLKCEFAAQFWRKIGVELNAEVTAFSQHKMPRPKRRNEWVFWEQRRSLSEVLRECRSDARLWKHRLEKKNADGIAKACLTPAPLQLDAIDTAGRHSRPVPRRSLFLPPAAAHFRTHRSSTLWPESETCPHHRPTPAAAEPGVILPNAGAGVVDPYGGVLQNGDAGAIFPNTRIRTRCFSDCVVTFYRRAIGKREECVRSCVRKYLLLSAASVGRFAHLADPSSSSSCIPAERDALLSFKAGITSDPGRWLRSWRQGEDCCRWYGVRCSARTGHVVKLDLHYNLSGNDLGGRMPMPEFMGSLQSLAYLNISNMNFSGQVPPQLGNLTKLVHLDIHTDYLYPDYLYSTYIYSSDISWLASLPSLEHLDMSGIDLSTTTTDWVHSVSTHPNLRVLYLGSCALNSSIPSLARHHNLTVLQKLDLHGNHFSSPAAPNWYWGVTSLKSLDIYYCGFTGPFPDDLGNLTMLETLDMEGNDFEGMIPSTLENMCSLRIIGLEYNDISGDMTDLIERIPKCSWNSLQELYLDETNLTGMTLKSLLNLTALTRLHISRNHLSGSVPIGKLKNLTELLVSYNSLSGVISEDHFSDLENLKAIDLSQTHLQLVVGSHWEPPFSLDTFSSCHMGQQIPNWLRRQSNILKLSVSDAGLVGTIPDWFWATFSNAKVLDLSYNQITGELPLNLEFMSVIMLYLQSNGLTGSIPQLPRNIVFLDISKNSLNGQLPSNFGTPYLQFAGLFSNGITGIIPDSVCRRTQLQVLDLSKNMFIGKLPDCSRENMKQPNLSSNNFSRVISANHYNLEIRTLLLNNNRLSGGFPLFLKQCRNLMFSGKLPAWISEDMPELIMLRLRSNNFSGHIPTETMRLVSLRILDLANNTFSGAIPQSLVNLKALATTVVDYPTDPFQEILSFVIKGQVLDYKESASFLTSIDLSCNRLAGQIPKEIASLIVLINLNLSSNLLSGNIPYEIGNLQSLESLDLSDNQLSGEIPQCMSNLTSLSYLNLSYNNLSGRIPSGNQLDTLMADEPASMYIGNPGLCGHPLPKVCPGDQQAQEGPIGWHEDYKTQMDFHLAFIVGFLVGLWIIFCSLLYKRTWRYTYFSLFDKLYDKVHVFLAVTWQQWFRRP